MSDYRIVAESRAENDVRSAFAWYENERAGLGTEFLKRSVRHIAVSSPVHAVTSLWNRAFDGLDSDASPTPCISLSKQT